MKKHLIILLIAVLLICVGLSGCNEQKDNTSDGSDRVENKYTSDSGTFNPFEDYVCSSHPNILCDNDDNLHLVWWYYGGDSEKYEILYSYKLKDGDWSSPFVVTSDDSCVWPVYPDFTVDSKGNVHVLWYDNFRDAIYYRMKSADGVWSSTEKVVGDLESAWSDTPKIAVDNDENVYVVYCVSVGPSDSEDTSRLYYKTKSKHGSWSSPNLLSVDTAGFAIDPDLTIDKEGNVYFIWGYSKRYSYDNGYIYMRVKQTNGVLSDPEIVISTQEKPLFTKYSIFTDENGLLHLMWSEQTNYLSSGDDEDIFYKSKSIWGDWTESELITIDSSTANYFTNFNIDNDGAIYLAFEECKPNTYVNSDIYFCYKEKYASWSYTKLVDLDYADSVSSCVDSDKNVYIVWSDGAFGHDYIFYKQLFLQEAGEHQDSSENQKPTAYISANPTSGEKPLKVVFTGSGIDNDGSVVSYYWDFKDGASSTEQNPSHTFTGSGTYEVVLTVTDNDGATDESTISISVEEKILSSYTKTPIDYATILSYNPDENYNNFFEVWQAYGSHTAIMFLKFDLTNIPEGATVDYASLSLDCTSTDESDGESHVCIYSCSDISWDEDTITWNNAPSYNDDSFGCEGVDEYLSWTGRSKTWYGSGGLSSYVQNHLGEKITIVVAMYPDTNSVGVVHFSSFSSPELRIEME